MNKSINFKKIIFLVVLSLFGIKANSQISSFSSRAEEKVEILPYDSTINFIELSYSISDTIKLLSYLNQTLYVVPQPETVRGYGYADFYKTPNAEYSNIYGTPAEKNKYQTNSNDLVGKYFVVKEVFIDNSKSYQTTKWLKLENKDNLLDVVWYRYPQTKNSFVFLVLAYYEHIKSKYVHNYYAINDAFYGETEGILAHKCVDIGIDNKTGKLSAQLEDGSAYPIPSQEYGIDYYAEYGTKDLLYKGKTILIFKEGSTTGESRNSLGIGYEVNSRTGSINKPIVILDDLTYVSAYKDIFNSDGGENGFFIKSDYDRLIKKYGATWMNLVVQQKIKVGMPEELVRLSWGNPQRINTDSNGLNQWVYGSDYVYIKNGVVSSWQQY